MKNLKLKSARAAKDLSQQALADLVGVSRQTINAIEKGDYNPTIKLCLAICRVLDKTLDELHRELHLPAVYLYPAVAGYLSGHADPALGGISPGGPAPPEQRSETDYGRDHFETHGQRGAGEYHQ